MPNPLTLIVAGTDTDVGKTVASAVLTLGLKACYWKPIQTGSMADSDRLTVQTLTKLPENHFIPEYYSFPAPRAPYHAAALAHQKIDIQKLLLLPNPVPPSDILIIECAGGLMVPITQDVLQIDLIQQWQHPVILCTRTTLGTLNHTLLSIEALKHRAIPIYGLLFIGEADPQNEQTLVEYTGIRSLGRIPLQPKLTHTNIQSTFDALSLGSL